MLRAIFITLLVACVFSGDMLAQRGAGFRGAGGPGFTSQRGVPNRFARRNGSSAKGSRGSGAGFLPYYWPFEDEEPADEVAPNEPAPSVMAKRTQVTAPAKPHLIEVPGAADSQTAQVLPPTVFIFSNGERLESRRFLLTANKLSVSDDRQERIFALDKLNLYATVNANRERGIALQIPAERNVICVGF
jgi:hypothetical protein